MYDLVKKVNDLLLAGEPGNISVDEHSGYTGYKPQAIIDAMNEVFWGKWGFEEVSSEIVAGDKGGLAVAQVRVFLVDVPFQPVGWGQNRVTRGDIGDARKGAQTDAIKKALSYFSIGNRAYHGLLDAKSKPAQNGHQAAPHKQEASQEVSIDDFSTPEHQPATASQIASIRKGCRALGKPEPVTLLSLRYLEAESILKELAREYGEKKASAGAGR